MEQPRHAASQLRLDDDGRILDDDLACFACGYILHGLSPDGACPECGTAIERSTQGNLLWLCHPMWVGRLAVGMQLLFISFVTAPLFGCIGTAVPGTMRASVLATSVALLIPATLRFFALRDLTTPNPSTLELKGSLSARQFVRAAMVAEFPIWPILPLAGTFSNVFGAIFLVVAASISLVASFATLIYARQLALRIPDRWLASQTRFVMWGLPTSCLILGVGYLITGFLPLPLGLVLLFFCLFTMMLMPSYLKGFREAARQARATWALDSGSARDSHRQP